MFLLKMKKNNFLCLLKVDSLIKKNLPPPIILAILHCTYEAIILQHHQIQSSKGAREENGCMNSGVWKAKILKSAKIGNSAFWKGKIWKSAKILISGCWKAKVLKAAKILNSGCWKTKILKAATILNSEFWKAKFLKSAKNWNSRFCKSKIFKPAKILN